jgi:hypothetical protein
MERTHLAKLSVNPILTLADLGLDWRASLDDASSGLARISEAQIVRSIQFPAGALFFTLAPDDPESGGVYVFDRRNGVKRASANHLLSSAAVAQEACFAVNLAAPLALLCRRV